MVASDEKRKNGNRGSMIRLSHNFLLVNSCKNGGGKIFLLILSNEIFTQYGLIGWPSYLIIDKSGRIVYKKTGFRENEMVKTILRAIDEEAGK